MTYPTIMPALTLDFQNSQQLDPKVTFSRSSSATYINSAGNVADANSDEARFEFDSNGNCLGLLMEESRTNLIPYSQVFATGYSGAQFTITDNAVVAPDGTTTAASLLETAVNDAHYVQLSSSSQTNLSQSIFVKPNGRDNICVRFVTTGSDWYTITFNLTGNGSITQEISGTGSNWTINSKSITQLSNGWYRISAGATTSAATIYIFSVLGCDSSTPTLNFQYGYPQYTGDVTKGYYFWGAQVEANTFPTSYIPTSGSTVNRAIDIAQLSTANVYGNEFTIINKPFGVSSGGSTLYLQGYPYIQRAVVYDEYLSQEQINTVTGVDEFWMWRVLGSSWEISPTMDGSVTVDWGDGTTETLLGGLVNHTFTNGSGYHEVGFRLDSGSWFSVNMNFTSAADREKVVAVGPMPANMATTGFYSYNYLSNVTAWDANLVHIYGGPNSHQLGRTYSGLTSLKSFPFTALDPLITSVSEAWRNCSNLNSFPLIDTSSIDRFNSAWRGCSSLTSFPLLDTSSGENFTNTWQGCSSLTSFPLLDTSSGTNFDSTWQGCSSLTSFPLLDTSSGTNFLEAWENCTGLTSFPLLDTSSGENFRSAWENCTGLTSFPLLDTSSGTDFQEAWRGCTNLSSFPLSDTSSGENFTNAWRGCSSLTSFPLLDTSSGEDFEGAWRQCTSLQNFPANLFDNWTGVPANNCFANTWDACTSLTATSVENILNSIDTSGQSAPASGVDITIDYDAGTGTPNITTAVTNLKSRSWTITLNNVAQ